MCCQGAPDVGGFVGGDSAALTVSQSRQHDTCAWFRGPPSPAPAPGAWTSGWRAG